jgi:hypothetical protein
VGGLEVNRDHEGLQTVPTQNNAFWGQGHGGEGPRRSILGLSVAAFWVVVGVLVLLLAGGVGGGVGGGLAAQKSNKASWYVYRFV